MRCSVYKSLARPLTYLYVTADVDWGSLPDTLLREFGEREQILTLDLQDETRLALASAADVLKSIRERGYYLQLPPSKGKGIYAQIH